MLQNEEANKYINSFSDEVSARLMLLRNMVLKLAPDAAEEFSYAMIGYTLHQKPLVYFGAYKKHLGMYALPHTHAAFAAQLGSYKSGKGSVQFLHSQDLPLELISNMIRFRISTIKTGS